MSKVCEICGKHPVAGRSISHSHRVTNRVFRPNVQKITIKDKNGRVRRANVCTRCMKAGKVERGIRRPTAGGKGRRCEAPTSRICSLSCLPSRTEVRSAALRGIFGTWGLLAD